MNGFTHTAWYVISEENSRRRLLLRGNNNNNTNNDTTSNSSHGTNSGKMVTPSSGAGSSGGKNSSLSSTNNSRPSFSLSGRKATPTTPNSSSLSYVSALASKGPREDLDSPQLRITLKVHIL
jgi:hypothetical protein